MLSSQLPSFVLFLHISTQLYHSTKKIARHKKLRSWEAEKKRRKREVRKLEG
jgi:hypothetical protein